MVDRMSQREPTPERSDVMAGSYAIHSDEQRIEVWEYRVDISAPDGEWHFMETFDHEKEPKLTLEYATLTSPVEDGYWVYSKSYDCELACE